MPAGIGVAWLGDWVVVASGMGVRVASDGARAVTVTVGAELWGGTRGLCGPYNDDPAGECHLDGNATAGTTCRRRQGHGPCPATRPSPPCAPR